MLLGVQLDAATFTCGLDDRLDLVRASLRIAGSVNSYPHSSSTWISIYDSLTRLYLPALGFRVIPLPAIVRLHLVAAVPGRYKVKYVQAAGPIACRGLARATWETRPIESQPH